MTACCAVVAIALRWAVVEGCGLSDHQGRGQLPGVGEPDCTGAPGTCSLSALSGDLSDCEEACYSPAVGLQSA